MDKIVKWTIVTWIIGILLALGVGWWFEQRYNELFDVLDQLESESAVEEIKRLEEKLPEPEPVTNKEILNRLNEIDSKVDYIHNFVKEVW